MKPFFGGRYDKCVADDGFSFAIIDSDATSGKELQLIFADGAHFLKDVTALKRTDQGMEIHVEEDGLSIHASLVFGPLHPLSKPVMGPFRHFKMQCNHAVYSMFHSVKGTFLHNGILHEFHDGYGYAEGDYGTSFPEGYVWFNSSGKDYGVTFAYATIPFGLIRFHGLLAFIKTEKGEWRLTTYTGARVLSCTKKRIVVKKGKYRLEITPSFREGHALKAPAEGAMKRLIKENLAVTSHVVFKKGKEVILEKDDPLSSMEFMMEEKE